MFINFFLSTNQDFLKKKKTAPLRLLPKVLNDLVGSLDEKHHCACLKYSALVNIVGGK